jgi:hypothetical protein
MAILPLPRGTSTAARGGAATATATTARRRRPAATSARPRTRRRRGATPVQHLWRDLVLLPPGKKELTELTNWEGHHVPIKRLIVAYHRNPNLANLNSYRKLETRTGLKPSSFIT